MKIYKKVVVQTVELQDWRECYDPTNKYVIDADCNLLLEKYTGDKRTAIELAMQGMNFNQIAKKEGWSTAKAYKIRKQLQEELAHLRTMPDDEAKRYVAEKVDELQPLVNALKFYVKSLSLKDFMDIFIYDYDPEAVSKGWKASEFTNNLQNIWDNNPKTRTLAPREHLKTTDLLAYITKKVAERDYAIEANYYHITSKIAKEKVRIIRRWVERNPLLGLLFDLDNNAKLWGEDKIVLSDGSVIEPLGWDSGAVGKHPHIIGLDDVINYKVIYSDQLNENAINKFYTDIYPQLSREDNERKIIIIGTSQRKDDLYHKLPKDFVTNTFSAIINEETREILSPDLFTFEHLLKIRADISELHGLKFWLKEYQNIPFEAMGMIIEPEWVKYYDELPEGGEDFQGWDLSVGKDPEKGDWTVGITIRVFKSEDDKIRVYVMAMYRGRIKFASRLDQVVSEYRDYQPERVGIEDVTFQYDTIQTLKDQTLIPIVGVKAVKNKVESFQTELAPYFENGQVLLSRDLPDIVKDELLGLPIGEHDDIADALKIAIKTALTEGSRPNIRFL